MPLQAWNKIHTVHKETHYTVKAFKVKLTCHFFLVVRKTHMHRCTVHTRNKAYNYHQMEEHSDLNTHHLAALKIQMTSVSRLSSGREALACYQFTINLSSC